MEAKTRATLWDVAKGTGRILPRLHIANAGLAQLALIRSGQRKSIGRLVEKWARKTPDGVALRDQQRSYTYAEFNDRANRVAHFLKARGVRRGDCVALLMQNRVDLLVLAAGVVKLGAAAAMLNYNQRGDILAHSLSITGPKVLLLGSECREAFESLRGQSLPNGLLEKAYWLADGNDDAPVSGAGSLGQELRACSGDNLPDTEEVTTSDAAFHVFTSGTTGLPKAAVMSHGRWLRAMTGVGLGSLRMHRSDVFYCPLPLYHNNALTLSWGAALGSGAELAIARKFSVSRFWDEVAEFNATAFCYIGELCRYLLAQPPHPREREHRIRIVLGNGLRPELWPQFRQRFNIPHINEFYGASECNLLFTNAFDVEPSCGFSPFAYAVVNYDTDTEQPVRDAKGRLQRVGKGEVGLLLSKVSNIAPFDGYTSKEEGEKKLIRDAFKKGDCYFNTGDLVRDMGLWHVQFVDRLGDTFRWKGENVATTEVERVINELAVVKEAVVYGVEVPGCEGRAGMASITLKPEQAFDGAALAKHLAARLPDYAIPLFVRLSESLSTTSTFKHQKSTLKQEAFHLDKVRDPLYMLNAERTDYTPLKAELYQQIMGQKIAV